MTAPAPQTTETDVVRLVAERTDDLTELLGHLANCWDEERRGLARKLHDNLGSSLTALTMHLSLLQQKLPPDPALQDRVGQMRQLLTQVVNANREMQLNLWNDKLEFLGIKAALNDVVERAAQEHGIKVRASLPEDDVECTREHSIALLRSAEEGLRNVARHAMAHHAEVVLDDTGETLVLTVRDDGIGNAAIDIDSRSCHGLRMLRERVRFLGGTIAVANAPGHGTILTVTLPR
ncbi:sensor histidine kinase [Pseudoduganella sp. GCM10020061]|uniref:sensor histidine kinase n=1 Tax=Pseudoduganella sp. GCM10020061 TaxID=3317345 RepID=UPI0036430EB2